MQIVITYYLGKIRKNIINLSPAVFALRVLKIKFVDISYLWLHVTFIFFHIVRVEILHFKKSESLSLFDLFNKEQQPFHLDSF